MAKISKLNPKTRDALQIVAAVLVCIAAAMNLIDQPVRLVNLITLGAGIAGIAVTVFSILKRKRQESSQETSPPEK